MPQCHVTLQFTSADCGISSLRMGTVSSIRSSKAQPRAGSWIDCWGNSGRTAPSVICTVTSIGYSWDPWHTSPGLWRNLFPSVIQTHICFRGTLGKAVEIVSNIFPQVWDALICLNLSGPSLAYDECTQFTQLKICKLGPTWFPSTFVGKSIFSENDYWLWYLHFLCVMERSALLVSPKPKEVGFKRF